MMFVCLIDIIVVAVLIYIATTKSVERALPFFIFVVVLLPEESVIPLGGLFTLTTRRVAVATLAALYLLCKNRVSRAAQKRKVPLTYLILAHVGWTIVSTAASVVPLISFKQLFSQVVEYFLLYYILVKTISRVATLHRILRAMVAAVFVACIFGSYEAYTGISVLRLFPTMGHRFGTSDTFTDLARGIRVMSTFGNYSLFGTAIAFAVVHALYLLNVVKTRAEKAFLWVAILLMFLNIYKTVSRGPWIALIIGFLFLFLFGQPRTRKLMTVIAILCSLVMIIRPGVREEVVNICMGTFADQHDNVLASSYQYRYVLIRVGREALAREPIRELWGYGLESWYYLNLTGPFGSNPEYHFLSGDNAYVVAMVETGYIGLLIFCVLLAKAAVVTLKDYFTMPRPDNTLSAIIFINMIQYYFMMTNVGIYGWGQTGYMLWTCIAMSMVYRKVAATRRAGTLGHLGERILAVDSPVGGERLSEVVAL